MASTNKTELGLNLWDPTDAPEREDFNSDNEIIQEAIDTLNADLSESLTALNNRLSGAREITPTVSALPVPNALPAATNRVEIEQAGLYLVTAFANVPAAASGVFALQYRVNQTLFRLLAITFVGMGGQQVTGTRFAFLEEGDVLEQVITQTSGATVNVSGLSMQFVRVR